MFLYNCISNYIKSKKKIFLSKIKIMTLHWTIIKEYSRKLMELKECKICSSLVTNIDLFEHFNNCYNNKIKILFKNFDNEISSIKLFYNNKIKLCNIIIY